MAQEVRTLAVQVWKPRIQISALTYGPMCSLIAALRGQGQEDC